mgnify:FL=1
MSRGLRGCVFVLIKKCGLLADVKSRVKEITGRHMVYAALDAVAGMSTKVFFLLCKYDL